MRAFLNGLYSVSGAVAALLMGGICLTILLQIVIRFLGVPFDGIEISAYLLAAMTFMGLAYTWRRGGHIRITILFDQLSEEKKILLDRATCIIAIGLCGFLVYYLLYFILESMEFNYRSRGIISFPLWIPQLSAAIGLLIFLIAIVDDAWDAFRGRTPNYRNRNIQHGSLE